MFKILGTVDFMTIYICSFNLNTRRILLLILLQLATIMMSDSYVNIVKYMKKSALNQNRLCDIRNGNALNRFQAAISHNISTSNALNRFLTDSVARAITYSRIEIGLVASRSDKRCSKEVEIAFHLIS